MIILGITGSIGMGKTTIASMLKILNLPVHDADKEVQEVLKKNKNVKKKIGSQWPQVIFKKKNKIEIDKDRLGNIVFKSPKQKKILENILHPLVINRRNKFLDFYSNKRFLVALDVPLLYEFGQDKLCDYIFLANTTENVQKKRILKRPNMSKEKFYAIKNNQLSFEEKKQKKPFIVSTTYGKLFTFMIVLFYLLIIIIREKFLNNERTCTRY